MTRLLVCGGRDFDDEVLFFDTLNGIMAEEGEDVKIVSGGAKGADRYAEEFAEEFGYDIVVFKPDWKRHGKSAGIIRNKQMLEYILEENPRVIAFWDGRSKGTKNTIETAKKIGIEPQIVYYEK